MLSPPAAVYHNETTNTYDPEEQEPLAEIPPKATQWLDHAQPSGAYLRPRRLELLGWLACLRRLQTSRVAAHTYAYVYDDSLTMSQPSTEPCSTQAVDG